MKQRDGWKGARYQDKGGSQTATKVFNVKIDITSLNPEYDVEVLPENIINEQGLLLVGRVIPKQSSFPEFLIRWDERAEHLNVDMTPDENYWRDETHGYRGHRLHKLDHHPGRAYPIIIATPKLNVIDAVISFNLARDMVARVTIGLHASAEETHGRT